MHADGRQTATGFFSFSEFHPLGKGLFPLLLRKVGIYLLRRGYLLTNAFPRVGTYASIGWKRARHPAVPIKPSGTILPAAQTRRASRPLH
jgi:hypothetical protein